MAAAGPSIAPMLQGSQNPASANDAPNDAPNDAHINSTPAHVQPSGPAQPLAPVDTPQKDMPMLDAPNDLVASAPARTATPAHGSRAASAFPDTALAMPPEAVPHGDPTRRYLNTKVTSVLLEGMKMLATDRPAEPLRVLGEYLLQRSKELESGG